MRTTPRFSRSMLAGALSVGLLFAAGQAMAAVQSAENEEKAKADSAQPVGDAWITTKVKADLLATEDVSGTDIKVETVNGVVKLSGTVKSQAQIDKAVSVAKGIDGVARVDSSGLSVGND